MSGASLACIEDVVPCVTCLLTPVRRLCALQLSAMSAIYNLQHAHSKAALDQLPEPKHVFKHLSVDAICHSSRTRLGVLSTDA